MSAPILQIESIRSDHDFQEKFRFCIAIGREFNKVCQISIDGANRYSLSRREYQEMVRVKGGDAVDRLIEAIREKMLEDLQRAIQPNGVIDNTAEFFAPQMAAWPTRSIIQELSTDNRNSMGPGILGFYAGQMGDMIDREILSLALPETPQKAKDRNTPHRKSMLLLCRKIGKQKYRQLKSQGYWEEKGKYGTYHFHLDKQGGVTLIEDHKFGSKTRQIEWSLCVQSSVADMPKGDVILSRWLEWRADEEKFLETANFRSIKTKDEALESRFSVRNGIQPSPIFGSILNTITS